MSCSITVNLDTLLMLIYFLHNAGDGLVLAFHQIGVVLLVSAYDEILDGHADHICTGKPRVSCEAVELIQPLVELPFLIGIQLMFGDVVYFLLSDALIKAHQGCERGENLRSVQSTHLGMPSAEDIIVMDGSVLENNAPISPHSCRNCK